MNFRRYTQLMIGLLMLSGIVLISGSTVPTGQAQADTSLSVNTIGDLVPLMMIGEVSADTRLAFDAEGQRLYALDLNQQIILEQVLDTPDAPAITYDLPATLDDWSMLTTDISLQVLNTLHPDFAATQAGLMATVNEAGELVVQQNDEVITIGSEAELKLPAFNAQGDILSATYPATQSVMLWESTQNRTRQHLIAGEAPVAIGADNNYVAVIHPFDSIELHRLRDVLNDRASVPVHHFQGHLNRVTALEFSVDGSLLFSGSADATISAWDTMTGAQTSILHGHTGTINQLQLTANDTLLISGSDIDHTLRFWDMENGRLLRSIEASHGHFAISEAGDLLATVQGDGQVVVYGYGSEITLPQMQILASDVSVLSAGVRGVAGRAQTFATCRLAADEAVLAVAKRPDNALLSYIPGCETPVWLTWEARVQWEDSTDNLPQLPPQRDPLLRVADYDAFCADAAANSPSGGSTPTQAAYPPRLVSGGARAQLSDGAIDVVVCFEYPTIVIENCHNIGPGNYSYIYVLHRMDTIISLVSYDSGTVLDQRRYEGMDPPACPTEAIRGDGFGETAPFEEWLPFIYGSLYGTTEDATFRTITTGSTTGYATPSTSNSITTLPAETPITPVGQSSDSNWLAVLTPQMDIIWVRTTDLSVAIQQDITALPVSTSSTDEFMIEVRQ